MSERTVVVVMNVLVEVTLISGPAWRYSVSLAARVIALPTTLVMATMGAPCSRARRVAASVSAV
jgi:hypothetical protein